MKIYKTNGIILRTVRYGETSLIVIIFTKRFGVQTYIVNGVRTSKKTGRKAAMYQPAAFLQLEVYHNEQKAINRIKEADWGFIYQNILSDVVKNSIAMFMIELLQKTLKQPEENPDLFHFCANALQQLDTAPAKLAANFGLYFSLHLAAFFGFRFNITATDNDAQFFDMQEGIFTTEQPSHPHYLQGEDTVATAKLIRVTSPEQLEQVQLNQQKRRQLLLKYVEFYALHMPEFGSMKSLPILFELLA